MNVKRFLAASLAVFLVFGIVDFVFDLTVLMPINVSLNAVWRPEAIRWLEPALYLYAALLFVYIFTVTYKSGGIRGGALYGLLTGLLVSGILSFKQFALYPVPLNLAVIWFIEGLIQFITAGIATALIYKPGK